MNRTQQPISLSRPAAVVTGSLLVVALLGLGGCAGESGARARTLLSTRAVMDFTGLSPIEQVESVRVTAAPPVGWKRQPVKRSLLYTHEQWKSPSGHTGVGVAYVRAPFPLSAGVLAWLAKQEYGKKAADGKILGEWTDGLGRHWFEAENAKYHVRGCITTRGTEAWIVYSGYRLNAALDPAEIALAARSAESYLPVQPAARAGGIVE